MSKTHVCFVVLAAALAAIGIAANARAELLLGDNFDGANPAAANGGINDNLSGRLTGTDAATVIAASSMWTLGDQVTGYPSSAVVNGDGLGAMDVHTTGTSSGQFNTTHSFDLTNDPSIGTSGGFSVVVDWAPKFNSSTANYWAYISLGNTPNTRSIWNSGTHPTNTTTGADFALVPNYDGTFRTVLHGWSGTTLTPTPYPTYDPSPAHNPGTMYRLELDVATTGFSSGTGATVNAWIAPIVNGVVGAATQLDLDGSASPGLSASFNWDGDGTNCIGFLNYDNYTSNTSRIDNLNVYAGLLNGSGVVPEPSALALLSAGLIGLLAYAWRKR